MLCKHLRLFEIANISKKLKCSTINYETQILFNIQLATTKNHFSSFMLARWLCTRLEMVLSYSYCGKMCYWLVTLRAYNIFIRLFLFGDNGNRLACFWVLSFVVYCLVGTARCVLEETMIMFPARKSFSKDLRNSY